MNRFLATTGRQSACPGGDLTYVVIAYLSARKPSETMRFLQFLILILVLTAPATAQDLAERQARQEALAEFAASGQFRTMTAGEFGSVIRGLVGSNQDTQDVRDPREIADAFIADHYLILGLRASSEVAFDSSTPGNGHINFVYVQLFDGVPVHDRDLRITVATQDGSLGPKGSISMVFNELDIIADIAPENAPVLELAAIEASVSSWQDSVCSVAFRSATLTLLPAEFTSSSNHMYAWAAVMDETVAPRGAWSFTIYMDAETGVPLFEDRNYDWTMGGPFQSSCVSTAVDGPHEVVPFAVYPNPVQTQLTIRGAESVDVIDVLGRVVATGTGSVDMSRLPAGLYLVRRTGTDEMRTVVRM